MTTHPNGSTTRHAVTERNRNLKPWTWCADNTSMSMKITTTAPVTLDAPVVTAADILFLHTRGGLLIRSTATGRVLAHAGYQVHEGYTEVMDAEVVYAYLAEFVTPAAAAAQITAELAAEVSA